MTEREAVVAAVYLHAQSHRLREFTAADRPEFFSIRKAYVEALADNLARIGNMLIEVAPEAALVLRQDPTPPPVEAPRPDPAILPFRRPDVDRPRLARFRNLELPDP